MNNINGLEVTLEWETVQNALPFVLGLGVIIISTICLITAIIRKKPDWYRDSLYSFSGFLVVALFVSVGAIIVQDSMTTSNKDEAYDDGITEIETHYGVKLLDGVDKTISGNDVFGNSSDSNFTSVVIEDDLSRIDGYVLNVEDDTYALVVEEGAESTDEFVEYSTELVNSDGFEEVNNNE